MRAGRVPMGFRGEQRAQERRLHVGDHALEIGARDVRLAVELLARRHAARELQGGSADGPLHCGAGA